MRQPLPLALPFAVTVSGACSAPPRALSSESLPPAREAGQGAGHRRLFPTPPTRAERTDPSVPLHPSGLPLQELVRDRRQVARGRRPRRVLEDRPPVALGLVHLHGPAQHGAR